MERENVLDHRRSSTPIPFTLEGTHCSDFFKSQSIVNNFVFRPPPSSYRFPTASKPDLDGEHYLFIPWGSDAPLFHGGSHIPCRLLRNTKSQFLMIYFHGNACDIGENSVAQMYCRELCVNILMPEYPGYGLHGGEPTEASVNRTADRVMKYLLHEAGVLPENIILYGQSIGTGVATRLARRITSLGGHPAGLILKSPYTSVRAIVNPSTGTSEAPKIYTIGQKFIIDRFRSIDHIPHIQCPILFIHGKKDNVIPYQHSCQLHEAATSSKDRVLHLIDEATHDMHLHATRTLVSFIGSFPTPPRLTMAFTPIATDVARGEGALAGHRHWVMFWRIVAHLLLIAAIAYVLVVVGVKWDVSCDRLVHSWLIVESALHLPVVALSFVSTQYGLVNQTVSVKYFIFRIVTYLLVIAWFFTGIGLYVTYEGDCKDDVLKYTMLGCIVAHAVHFLHVVTINH